MEDHGTNLNIRNHEGNTALHKAASTGKNEEVTNLIKKGVDLNTQNYDGNTALHLAASNGYTAVITTLIKAEANLNIQNQMKTTALHWPACVSAAIAHGYSDIVFQFMKLHNDVCKGNLTRS